MTDTAATSATFEWTDLDKRAVDTVRLLAADAVQKVGNGHPGTAMSLAPAAYMLYHKVMKHDPSDPNWAGRDRFVLSAGHSSITQYVQLYMAGYGLEMDDLKALRTWGSLTPGHPEYGHTAGVEITTGPLGQGLASAVGMAMAARRERGLFDPQAAAGASPFDHHVYVIASDGDLQEGVTAEASSIAGHQELGNLVVVYDQNHISIEDDTDIAFTEDVAKRYEAYNWHVQKVDWTVTGEYVEDVKALWDAFEAAKAETSKPSIILLRTIIAWPAPTKQGTGASHGSALGADEIKATKELLGFPADEDFYIAPEVFKHVRGAVERGAATKAAWLEGFEKWAAANPEQAQLHERLAAGRLPDGWEKALPVFPAGKDVSTRKASGAVLDALAPVLPELWGGSADLAESNNTTMKGEPSFVPAHRSTDTWTGNPYGRTLHFGIREHAMGSILAGIRLHGNTRPYGGTFLQFSDYMRGAVRLTSLMNIPVTYVWTHDSIGLGEDGPTHQPVEHLAALRAIPNLSIVRPADANETAWAWRANLERNSGPVGLILSRQNLPTFDREAPGFNGAEGVARGGYVLAEADGGDPKVILVGTGSEVQLAVEARERLQAEGIPTRVVSLPCFEWFNEQDANYKASVFPHTVKARVSVEAGLSLGWREIVGDAGRSVSVEGYGASADYKRIFKEYGVTADAVYEAAKESLRGVE
ncbi:transketolase [Kineosporia babensis]|uniref:Transketolase n=1 Tax=Kineosporia babensis TaxID=499548 RepID=A0A9X1SYS9_9ACTN|nr:transketolase [Kineosporia babensis]